VKLSLEFIIFFIFLGLKLAGAITWSWWWVTAPLWIGGLLTGGLWLAALALGGTGYFLGKRYKAKHRVTTQRPTIKIDSTGSVRR
jgi:hypothetical protein